LTKHAIDVIIHPVMTMHSSAPRIGRRDMPLSWGVGLFLFAVYLLSYRGGFHSVDEVSMFAVTESLVKFGQFNTDQIAWTQWTTSQREAQGFFGVDGHVYSKKGLAMSLALAPLYWFGLTLPGLGMLQTASLLNALVTATTAGLLFSLVRRLGYTQRTALGVALLYGLATIAWVYSKYLFSEPLVGLLLLATATLLVIFRQAGGNWRALLAGLLAGLAVVTRANNLFLVPVFAAYLLAVSWQKATASPQPSATSRLLPTVCYLLGLVPPAAMFMGYNWARAGNPLQTGYDLTIFSPDFLQGLYKLLFSPLRGLFLYSPLLILSLPGLAWLWRRHRPEAGLAAGVTCVTVLLFSVWTSGEGLSWGSRFLVPVVPFLCLALAPVLERAQAGSKILVGLLLGIGTLSVAIQVLGIAVNPWVFLAQVQADFGGEFFLENTPALTNLGYYQALGQLRAWSVTNSDLAWWQPWGFDAIALGLSLILVVGAAANLKSPWPAVQGGPIPNSAILAIPTLLITYALLARYFVTDRQFGPPADSYTQALTAAAAQAHAGETLISVAPYHYHVPMNRFKARLPIFGMAQSSTALPATAVRLLGSALAGPNVGLITRGLLPAAPDNPVEGWLASNAFKASDEWFDDTRLVWYSVEQPTLIRPMNVTLGQELRLVSVKLVESSQAGYILPVEFMWVPLRKPAANYNLFLQILAPDGTPIAQHDGPPNGGYTPTSTWPPGEQVADRHGLALPRELPAGAYQLIAGLVDPATGRRLAVDPGRDFVELGSVSLEAAPHDIIQR
jgi:hypothetical protein